MTMPTHLLMGLVIGKATGNYALATIPAVVPDIDHLYSYVKSGVIAKPKLFWVTVMDQKDPYGNQRGILHNVLFFVIVSAILIVLFKNAGAIISLGWFSHIFLDAIDRSDYWPLYPNKRIVLHGPIAYGTRQEFLFSLILIVLFFVV